MRGIEPANSPFTVSRPSDDAIVREIYHKKKMWWQIFHHYDAQSQERPIRPQQKREILLTQLTVLNIDRPCFSPTRSCLNSSVCSSTCQLSQSATDHINNTSLCTATNVYRCTWYGTLVLVLREYVMLWYVMLCGTGSLK